MKKVALITGGSRGIGFGIAVHLAQNGFDLAINGVRAEQEAGEAIKKLKDLGSAVIYCPGDISLRTGRKQILQQVKTQYNRLDVLVNNAGKGPKERKDILEATEESFDDVLATNLKGNYFIMQDAANWMISQKQQDHAFAGCIINITSVSAAWASVNRGEYCISKAGLSMASQLFAVRLGEFNIPVYEVRPGIIHSDMTAGVKQKYDRMIEQGLCVQKRWGEPDDVGRVVASLAKGDFGYSTGQVFTVDGGLTIPRF